MVFLSQSGGTHELSIDLLADLLVSLHTELSQLKGKGELLNDFVERYKDHIQHLLSAGIGVHCFDTLKVLGRGAYGEVRLVRHKETKKVLAMKLMTKSKMRGNKEAAYFREERDVMALSESSWITTLHYAFQDERYIYLVMEYNQGGNLLTQLFKDDVFDEATARFYLAEAILSINAVHELGYIHRDVKPENLMFDSKGHIKITDFGTCIRMDENKEAHADAPIGTPEYISPEMLKSQDKGGVIHGVGVDWWAVGVILYEMLIGEVPFYSESLLEMYGSIMKYDKSSPPLEFPDDIEISPEAKDLCSKLICRKQDRLDFEGIKKHPFFKDIDWENIRNQTPPFVPALVDDADTSNFEEIDEESVDPLKETAPKRAAVAYNGDGLPFIGYTFSREQYLSEMNQNQTSDTVSPAELEAIRKQVATREKEMEKLQRESEERALEIDNLQEALLEQQEMTKGIESKSKDNEKITKGMKAKEKFKVLALKTRLENESKSKLAIEKEVLKLETEILNLKKKLAAETLRFRRELEEQEAQKEDMIHTLEHKVTELETAIVLLERERANLQSSMDKINAGGSTGAALNKTAQVLRDAMMKERLDKEKQEKQEAEAKIKEARDQLEGLLAKNQEQLDARRKEHSAAIEKLEDEKKVYMFRIQSNKKKNSVVVLEKLALGSITKAQARKVVAAKLKNEQQLEQEKVQNKELTKRLQDAKESLVKLQATYHDLEEETRRTQQENAFAKNQIVVLPLQASEGNLEGYIRVRRPGPKYARFGFKKVFARVQGYSLDVFNKEEDVQLSIKPYFSISIKSAVFLVLAASSEDTRNIPSHEAKLAFTIYEKENEEYDPKKQPDFGEGTDAGLDLQPILFITRNEQEKADWMVGLQQLRHRLLSS